jgi:hypothetical protein
VSSAMKAVIDIVAEDLKAAAVAAAALVRR